MAILCSPMELSVSLPTVESDVNLVVTFPEDPTVQNVDYSKKTKISCQLEFSSTKPISKSDYIIVTDKRSDIRCSTQYKHRLLPLLIVFICFHRKRIPFTVVADNSLFTLYTLLANSMSQSITKGDDHLPSPSLQPRYHTQFHGINLHSGNNNNDCDFQICI